MAKVLKKEVLDTIRADVELFAKVATELDVKPVTLAATIGRNGNNLNKYSVVALVAEHLGTDPEQLMEEKQD